DGTRSIRATTFRGSGGCSLHAVATPPMSPSAIRSVLILWSASKFSRTKLSRPVERRTRPVDQTFGFDQGARQPMRPGRLAGLVSQEILAYFELDMRNRAPLTVDRNRVVAFVADRVGLIVSDHDPALAAKQFEQNTG